MKKHILFVLFFMATIGFFSVDNVLSADNVNADIKGEQLQETITSSGNKYKLLSVTFDLTDDVDFEGEAEFDGAEPKAIFLIKNISKEPVTFADAKYYLVKKDGSKFLLEFKKIENSDIAQETYIINPAQKVKILCQRLDNAAIGDLKGSYILLKNGRKIYFEYEELTNWNTLVRKTLGMIGIKKEKKYPQEEGWQEFKSSTGKVFHYRKADE